MAGLSRGRRFFERILSDGVPSVNTVISRTDTRTETVTVPSDFATIPDALDTLHERRSPPGVRYEILIESGHEIDYNTRIEDKDLRHVSIKSQDQSVPVASTFTDKVFEFRRTVAPVIDIHLQGTGDQRWGFDVGEQSTLVTEADAGASNLEIGMVVQRGSTVFAQNCEWTDNDRRGVSVNRGSLAYLGFSDFSANGNIGLRVASSTVNAEQATITNSDEAVAVVNGGSADINGSAISDNTGSAIRCDTNGRVTATDVNAPVTIDNCGRGVLATSDAKVSLIGAEISGSDNEGVYALEDGRVLLEDCSISGSGSEGVRSRTGSHVVLANTDVTESGDDGVSAEYSTASIQSSEVSGSTGIDLSVSWGGILRAGTVTSASTESDPHEEDMNVSPNTVHGEGIIFAESTEQ